MSLETITDYPTYTTLAPLKVDVFGRPIADNRQISIRHYLETKEESDTSFATDRTKQNPLLLMTRAIGSPAVIVSKSWRLIRALFNTFYLPAQKKRLQRLNDIGFIETIPSQKQLWFGSYDMLRYFISPGADSYYRTKGINFTFHQILRFLNDPSGLSDPIGIRVPRDTIICHLLEVVHANPVYDLQLLDQFEDGLEEMEKQTAQMLDGSHPRYRSITAIIEEPDYHQRLYQYVKRYRNDSSEKQMVRASGAAREDVYFLLAECTFGTLPAAFRYFNRLPNTFSALWQHAKTEKVINPKYCDPWITEQLEDRLASSKP